MSPDTGYKPRRVTLDSNEHNDAKEFNDLVVAIANRDLSAAKEAVEAMMAIAPDMREDDRYVHLMKVAYAVLLNQLSAQLEAMGPEAEDRSG